MFKATMPETPVKEHRHPQARENEIRGTNQCVITTPSTDFFISKNRDKPDLGRFSILRFYARHNF